MRRRILPVSAAAALLASAALTGCSAASSSASCEAPLSSGAMSSSVRVTGDSADSLKITVDSGAGVLNAQRSIVSSAGESGRVVAEGDIVATNIAYVDSSNGEILQASTGFGTGNGDSLFIADPEAGTIVEGIICAAEGDTVAVVLSELESASMGVDSPLVIVAEVTSVYSPRAEGKLRSLPTGFPAVTTDASGQPGIVLPPQDAPSDTRSAVRIEGSGETVAEDASVIGNVLTVAWDGTLSTNTWNETPQNFGTEVDPIASFRAELTGLPVGSQVVVIEPGDGAPKVSVIDILATV